jgi:hypothetical protein
VPRTAGLASLAIAALEIRELRLLVGRERDPTQQPPHGSARAAPACALLLRALRANGATGALAALSAGRAGDHRRERQRRQHRRRILHLRLLDEFLLVSPV